MMYPILCKVRYESLHKLLSHRALWKQLAFSVVVNWIVAPLFMACITILATVERPANHLPAVPGLGISSGQERAPQRPHLGRARTMYCHGEFTCARASQRSKN